MATALKIDTVFRAVDKATAPIKKVQKSMTLFSKKTQKALKISKKSVDQFDRKVKRMAGNVKRNIKFMSAGLAVAGVAGVHSFAKMGDEIAKTSRQVGLSAEALQELRFAADRQGISNEEFTKSFQKMNKLVGEARNGQGALTSFLKKSNPELLNQIKHAKNSEEAFNLIMNTINKMPKQVDRAAFANAAFGKSGVKMLIMAEGGADSINKLRNEFKELGGTISNEAATSAEKYVDSMTNLKTVFKGVWVVVASKIVPIISKVTERVTAFVLQNKALIQQKLEKVFNTVGKALSFVWKVVKKTYAIFKKLKPVIIPIVAAFLAYATVMKTLAIVQGIMTAAQWAMNVAMTANPVGLIIAGIVALIAIIVLVIKKLKKSEKAMKFFKKVGGFFKKIGRGLKGAWQLVKKITSNIWNAIKTMFGHIKKINDAVLGHIRKTFFDLIHGILFVIGGMMKGILKAGRFFAKIFGIDTTGIDNAIDSIRELQGYVKEQSHFATGDTEIKKTVQVQSKEANKFNFGRGQIDVDFKNAPLGVQTKTNSRKMNGVSLNTGRQPALVGGW